MQLKTILAETIKTHLADNPHLDWPPRHYCHDVDGDIDYRINLQWSNLRRRVFIDLIHDRLNIRLDDPMKGHVPRLAEIVASYPLCSLDFTHVQQELEKLGIKFEIPQLAQP